MKLIFHCAVLGCFAAVMAGCSSHGGAVYLERPGSADIRSERFPQAYISNVRAGEYDIIFLDNAQDWRYRKARRNRPLEPIPLAPLRQVMHIHLYWRPLTGTTNNPAAINASIDWYVLGPDGTNDLLIYQGAGYVTVRGSGEKRTVTIRDGRIKPGVNRGGMSDPIGSSRISGSIVAALNDARVQETLEEMEATGAASETGPERPELDARASDSR